jgi:hypothetical protein
MTNEQWTAKDLAAALKRFPPNAEVYEMWPNGPASVERCNM